jgi:hypothetical protein
LIYCAKDLKKGESQMLLEQLKQITDPRSYHGREYRHHHIIYFTILALLSNAKSYVDIARFIAAHFDMLKKLFHLKWRRFPDPSAIRKIIVALDPQDVERVFRADAEQLSEKTQADSEGSFQQICFDGKALCGSFSHTKNKRSQGVFSAFSACKHLVLAHIPLGEKNHEIEALQTFLLSLNLKDVIVTADAIHCQKKHLSARQSLQPSY